MKKKRNLFLSLAVTMFVAAIGGLFCAGVFGGMMVAFAKFVDIVYETIGNGYPLPAWLFIPMYGALFISLAVAIRGANTGNDNVADNALQWVKLCAVLCGISFGIWCASPKFIGLLFGLGIAGLAILILGGPVDGEDAPPGSPRGGIANACLIGGWTIAVFFLCAAMGCCGVNC